MSINAEAQARSLGAIISFGQFYTKATFSQTQHKREFKNWLLAHNFTVQIDGAFHICYSAPIAHNQIATYFDPEGKQYRA